MLRARLDEALKSESRQRQRQRQRTLRYITFLLTDLLNAEAQMRKLWVGQVQGVDEFSVRRGAYQSPRWRVAP